MSLRDIFIRHQVLLTRLVNTQARNTKSVLREVEKYLLDNLENSQADVIETKLNEMVLRAMPLLYKLGQYETKFTAKHVKKARELQDFQVDLIIDNIKVPTTLNKNGLTIKANYMSFARTKAAQYMQIIRDSRIMNEDIGVTKAKIKSITQGLFTVQNKALAQISVIAVANQIRKETTFNVR